MLGDNGLAFFLEAVVACPICGVHLMRDRIGMSPVLRHGPNYGQFACQNANKLYEAITIALRKVDQPSEPFQARPDNGYDYLTRNFTVRGRIVSIELITELLAEFDRRPR